MIYGLIGKTLKHSYSLQIHNFLGNDEYEIKEIKPENLDDFMKEKDFKGINVTIPYKEEVMKYCVLSPQAEKIGSVNTIVNNNGTLYGYNTDYFGFLEMTKRKNIDFKNQKVVILGSGGTSKTAKAVCMDQGAKEIVVVSRNGEYNYENTEKYCDADIVINTTPIGMYPNNGVSPIDLTIFTCLKAAVDVIYNPLKSNFLLQRNDIITAGGLPMLVGQAVYAHNLFFDVDITEKMDDAIENSKKTFSNYILVGMPGVGKSTTGKKLSKKLGLKFIDTDKEIVEFDGRQPKEIIEQDGEKAFREIESKIIRKFSKEKGLIIATGGGSILLEKNRKAMKENGIIIYLDRNIKYLSTKNRPLSSNLYELYKVRKPIYESVLEIHIKNARHPKDAAEKIYKILCDK